MLSVVAIQSNSVKGAYHMEEDNGYYMEFQNEKELYQWMGKGAEKQGLTGSISKEDYTRVFNGILPSGDMVGKRNKDNWREGRPGYDLTFSLNKELSLIICCSENQELREYFLDAHINAVKTAMTEVEKMTSARVTENGVTRYEPTKNMISGLFTHFSSRAEDPQVHTHALIANATQRADGKWRALSTDMTRKNGFFEKSRDYATHFGCIYQNEVAHAVREKGFEISPAKKHGMFTIDVFPRSLVEEFSKRSKQISEIMDGMDVSDETSHKVRSMIAKQSRASKSKIHHKDLWAKTAREVEEHLVKNHQGKPFSEYENEGMSKKEEPLLDIRYHTREAVSDAVRTLSVFNTQLNYMKIVDKAVEYDIGGSTTREIERAIADYMKAGGLFKTDSDHFVSQELVNQEKSFIDLAKAGVHSSKLSGKKNPTVLDHLKNSRFCVYKEPDSQVGKEKAINKLIDQLEQSGKKVQILTQTKSMAESYLRADRDKVATLWQRLEKLGQADKAQSIHGFLYQYEESIKNPVSNFFAKKKEEAFIIEGADTLSFEVAEKLIKLTEKRGVKIVFLSYDEGLRAPAAGNVMAMLKKANVPIVYPRTQKPPKPLNLAIHEVRTEGLIRSQDKQRIRQEKVAKTVVQEYGRDLGSVRVLSSTPESVIKQNNLIRTELQRAGLLDEIAIQIPIERKVYLSTVKQKQAKSFKKGWVAKTYTGNGQYSESPILKVDKDYNLIKTTGLLGREKWVSLSQFTRNKDMHLVERGMLSIAHGDRIRVNTPSRQSKNLGLSLNTGYVASLEGEKLTLRPDNPKLKTHTIRASRLKGMDLGHDYAQAVGSKEQARSNHKTAILDMPSYQVKEGTIKALNRQYSRLELYTDNKEKAFKELGKEHSIVLASELSPAAPKEPLTPVQQAVNYGLEVVSSREAAFTYQSVFNRAVLYGVGRVKRGEIVEELRERVRSGDIRVKNTGEWEVLLATQETVDLENKIISQIKDGQGALTPLLGKDIVQKRMDETQLTEGQKEACTLLATTQDRFVMVQGYAGTGKSTMLKTLKSVLEDEGAISHDSIIALAPTHKAVKELKEKGLEAQTLKSFLVDEHLSAGKTAAGDKVADLSHLKDKLILLDESSMVSNQDFKSLQDIVEKAEMCRCAYIGDKAQLSAVEAGKPSELALISKEADIATATMDEVLRQKDLTLKSVAKSLMASSPASIEKAFGELKEAKCIEEAKDPIEQLAKDYAAKSLEDRQDTLIAIATNSNRKLVNEAIREKLIEKGDLSGPQVTATRLVDSRLTNAELKHIDNYRSGSVLRINSQYYHISGVDKKTSSLSLVGESGAKTAINFNHFPKGTVLELFEREDMTFQAGDHIKWTKTDKERGVTAHEGMVVQSVDVKNNQIIAKTASGQIVPIDLKEGENQHLDYSYASTVHGLQGATAKYIMILLDSANRRSNNMRLLYVAATRAMIQARLYTNNLSDVQRQITHTPGDKLSALEAMDLLAEKNASSDHAFAKADGEYSGELFRERPPAESMMDVEEVEQPTLDEAMASMKEGELANDRKVAPPKTKPERRQPKIDAKQVESALRAQVETICKDILGERNEALSNDTTARYGKKGSLTVNISGPHQGSFYNFETAQKGGMISLLMAECEIDFKTALARAERMLGGDLSVQPIERASTPKSPEGLSQEKLAYIQSIIRSSRPLQGTVAEKYLKSRGIKTPSNEDIRFIQKINTGGGNKEMRHHASALLLIARDKNSAPQAVQMTYLDSKTGEKLSELPIAKRTIGTLRESTVNLTPGIKDPQMTIAAEGVETALSIKDSLSSEQKDHTQVVATLGKSNLAKVASPLSADKIMLALDNDKTPWQQDKSVKSAMDQIQGKGCQVSCIQPQLLNDQKTDYNDLAQAGKTSIIQQDIKQGLSQFQEAERAMARNTPASSPIEIKPSASPDLGKIERRQDREVER